MQNRAHKRKPAINDLVDDLNELMRDLNKNPVAREYDIAGLVSNLAMNYKYQIEKEEAERPAFQMSVSILDKLDRRRVELAERNDQYEKAFKSYELRKERLQSELDTLHDEVIEAQGEAALSKMRNMVDMQMMHHKIQDQQHQIDSAVEESCCSCLCFGSLFSKKRDEVVHMQLELEKLIRARDALKSEDPEIFRKAFSDHIEERREKLREELSRLIENPPVKNTDELSSEIATMEANIEYFWNLHTHLLKPEAMLDSITFYESLVHLKHDVLDKLSKQHDKTGHDFYHKVTIIQEKIAKFIRQFKKKLNEFFCVDADDANHTIVFDIYHKRFCALPHADQRRLRYHPDLGDDASSKVFEEDVVGMKRSNPALAIA